jgi:hypothetical protein
VAQKIIFGPTLFWDIFFLSKYFGAIFLGPKLFMATFVFGPEFFLKTFLGLKKLWPKIICPQQILAKNFDQQKIIFWPTFFWEKCLCFFPKLNVDVVKNESCFAETLTTLYTDPFQHLY